VGRPTAYSRAVTARTSVDGVAGSAAPAVDAGDISALMFASRAVTAAVVRALESVDASVTVPQMRVLVLLWTGEPLNLSAVAEGLGVNSSNASRTCDRLVAAGLVDRGEGPVDRRQVALTLTTQGRSFVERLMARREHELSTIVARMDQVERQRLMTALEPFNRAAGSHLWPSGEHPVTRDRRLLEWGI
jgi:DNA-binding MarR family transcriptional regulator